jgi:glycosyltransferase involved in cell wall biosynthesis
MVNPPVEQQNHNQLLRVNSSCINLNSLVSSAPDSACETCVVVPVRDEAELLESSLSALLHQVDFQEKRIDPSRYEVIVLANNCRDHSAAIARQFGHMHPEFRLHVVERNLDPADAYIGRVRQLLTDEAYRRLMSLRRRRGVIASTDGDTQVAPSWIAATQYEIGQGADAVGGRILTDPLSLAQLSPAVRWRYWRSVYYHHLKVKLESCLDADLINPWPRHHQNYGASLAFTAEIYEKAGGMPNVRSPEDVAFCKALARVNTRFRHSPRVRVMTSARQIGRTDIGFANQLAQWSVEEQPYLVESLGALETRFRTRRQLRILWEKAINGCQTQVEAVSLAAHTLGISGYWLLNELRQASTFGVLMERIEQQQEREGVWESRWAMVELEPAIASLRRRTYWLYKDLVKTSHLENSKYEPYKS